MLNRLPVNAILLFQEFACLIKHCYYAVHGAIAKIIALANNAIAKFFLDTMLYPIYIMQVHLYIQSQILLDKIAFPQAIIERAICIIVLICYDVFAVQWFAFGVQEIPLAKRIDVFKIEGANL